MNHTYSRSDRNRVRRGLEHDRPRSVLALPAWASACTRRAFPGQRLVPFEYGLKLMYPQRSITALGLHRTNLARVIRRSADGRELRP